MVHSSYIIHNAKYNPRYNVKYSTKVISIYSNVNYFIESGITKF